MERGREDKCSPLVSKWWTLQARVRHPPRRLPSQTRGVTVRVLFQDKRRMRRESKGRREKTVSWRRESMLKKTMNWSEIGSERSAVGMVRETQGSTSHDIIFQLDLDLQVVGLCWAHLSLVYLLLILLEWSEEKGRREVRRNLWRFSRGGAGVVHCWGALIPKECWKSSWIVDDVEEDCMQIFSELYTQFTMNAWSREYGTGHRQVPISQEWYWMAVSALPLTAW